LQRLSPKLSGEISYSLIIFHDLAGIQTNSASFIITDFEVPFIKLAIGETSVGTLYFEDHKPSEPKYPLTTEIGMFDVPKNK
jgi:hypothetical protein